MPTINTFIGFAGAQTSVTNTVEAFADVTGISQAQVDSAQRVRISCTTGVLRYRYDGGDPATDEGHTLTANSTVIFEGNATVRDFKYIGNGGSTATIFFTLER